MYLSIADALRPYQAMVIGESYIIVDINSDPNSYDKWIITENIYNFYNGNWEQSNNISKWNETYESLDCGWAE